MQVWRRQDVISTCWLSCTVAFSEQCCQHSLVQGRLENEGMHAYTEKHKQFVRFSNLSYAPFLRVFCGATIRSLGLSRADTTTETEGRFILSHWNWGKVSSRASPCNPYEGSPLARWRPLPGYETQTVTMRQITRSGSVSFFHVLFHHYIIELLTRLGHLKLYDS